MNMPSCLSPGLRSDSTSVSYNTYASSEPGSQIGHDLEPRTRCVGLDRTRSDEHGSLRRASLTELDRLVKTDRIRPNTPFLPRRIVAWAVDLPSPPPWPRPQSPTPISTSCVRSLETTQPQWSTEPMLSPGTNLDKDDWADQTPIAPRQSTMSRAYSVQRPLPVAVAPFPALIDSPTGPLSIPSPRAFQTGSSTIFEYATSQAQSIIDAQGTINPVTSLGCDVDSQLSEATYDGVVDSRVEVVISAMNGSLASAELSFSCRVDIEGVISVSPEPDIIDNRDQPTALSSTIAPAYLNWRQMDCCHVQCEPSHIEHRRVEQQAAQTPMLRPERDCHLDAGVPRDSWLVSRQAPDGLGERPVPADDLVTLASQSSMTSLVWEERERARTRKRRDKRIHCWLAKSQLPELSTRMSQVLARQHDLESSGATSLYYNTTLECSSVSDVDTTETMDILSPGSPCTAGPVQTSADEVQHDQVECSPLSHATATQVRKIGSTELPRTPDPAFTTTIRASRDRDRPTRSTAKQDISASISQLAALAFIFQVLFLAEVLDESRAL